MQALGFGGVGGVDWHWVQEKALLGGEVFEPESHMWARCVHYHLGHVLVVAHGTMYNRCGHWLCFFECSCGYCGGWKGVSDCWEEYGDICDFCFVFVWVGISCRPVERYGIICVMLFALSFWLPSMLMCTPRCLMPLVLFARQNSSLVPLVWVGYSFEYWGWRVQWYGFLWVPNLSLKLDQKHFLVLRFSSWGAWDSVPVIYIFLCCCDEFFIGCVFGLQINSHHQ